MARSHSLKEEKTPTELVGSAPQSSNDDQLNHQNLSLEKETQTHTHTRVWRGVETLGLFNFKAAASETT